MTADDYALLLYVVPAYGFYESRFQQLLEALGGVVHGFVVLFAEVTLDRLHEVAETASRLAGVEIRARLARSSPRRNPPAS